MAIDAENDYAWGYSLLSDAYHREGKDDEAIQALDRLRQRFPDNPWPVQAQMYVYHENLSATDRSAYQKTYALYLELQKQMYLPQITNADDVEAGFIESNLTTGRYAVAVDRGAKLLDRTKEQPDLPLAIPVRLIVYAALVLQRDPAKAGVALGALESALTKLPKDYKAEWSYQGTLRYIRASNVPEPLKTRLVDLVQAVDKDPVHVPPAVLQANREALQRKGLF
jgi:tetratricopeptide (TPR) repeat protein